MGSQPTPRSNRWHCEKLKRGAPVVFNRAGYAVLAGHRPTPSAWSVEDAPGEGAADVGQVRLGPYIQRELYFQGLEELGAFRFEYLHNDGQKQHNIW